VKRQQVMTSLLSATTVSTVDFKFSIGQRVVCTTGERGQIIEGWRHGSGTISYAVEKEDGRIIEITEAKIHVAVASS